MPDAFDLHGVRIPWLLYGTAWKEDRTAALTRLALDCGFVGIDTANQRKHYVEAAVGEAIAASGIPRERLFLQTKFTYARGQDHRLPYDPAASPGAQVAQSFARSCEHLGTSVVDSYLLHGPAAAHGWTATDREVWRAMEALHRAGSCRLLGVSNIAAAQLAALCDVAEVPPALVQNRCYARTGWDLEVRTLCRERGIVYEGFSLLTANRNELASPSVTAIARRHDATTPQVVFAFANALGMVALTGTTDAAHMHEDQAALAIDLAPDEIAVLERITS